MPETFVVAGASGAIGAAVAAELLAEGRAVVGIDRAEAVVSHPFYIHMRGNVLENETWEGAHDRAVALGNLVGLVYAAGAIDPRDAGLETLSLEVVLQAVAVHVGGLALGMQRLVPALATSGRGCVVNLSSIAAARGSRRPQLAYTAAKAASEALVRECAVAWGARGVRMLSVAPGPIDTPLLRTIWKPGERGNVAQIPLGRLGTPRDVAKLVAALLGEAGAYLSGVTVAVDGGLSVTNPC